MSPVLVELIGVTARHTSSRTRRAQQREPDGAVVTLVRAVLDIGKNRGAIGTALVCLIDPMMRGYLELAIEGDGPLDGADLPVISSHLVGRRKREDHFEICRQRSPVDGLAELDAIARVAGRQPDRLHKLRSLAFARYLHSHAHRAVLNHANLGRAAHVRAWRRLLLVKIHVPCGPLFGRIVGDGKPDWCGEQILVDRFIENAGYIAVRVERDAVARVLQRCGAHLQLRRGCG